MNKKDTRWKYFDKDWFKKYQKTLIILLNLPLLKLWTRRVLGIHNSVKYSEYVCNILPNNYTIYVNKTSGIADFRTHDRFSKNIYFAFKYWWLLLHWLDEILIDRYVPELSFGFGGLHIDVIPDTNCGGTSCDGTVGRVATEEHIWGKLSYIGELWPTLRNGIGTNATCDTTTMSIGLTRYVIGVIPELENHWGNMNRGLITFDISSLPEGAECLSNTLYLTSPDSGNVNEIIDPLTGLPDETLQLCVVNTYRPAIAGQLVPSDFTLDENWSIIVLDDPITWAMIQECIPDWYMTFAINVFNSFPPIDGILRFGLRSLWDVNNTPPTWPDYNLLDSVTSYITIETTEVGNHEPRITYYYSTDNFQPITCLL